MNASFAAALLLVVNTQADVSPIGPFTGNRTETWESFNDYLTGPRYLPNPTSILGGAAAISNPLMGIYTTNSPAGFGLGSSGGAQAADGRKGMGVDGFAQTTTITFLNPVVDFGAYWGSATFPWGPEGPQGPPTPNTVSLAFSDGSFASFSYLAADKSGILDWHGWHFTNPITSLTYSGDFVVLDGLQANVVPEPAIVLLFALGAGLSIFRIRLRNRTLH